MQPEIVTRAAFTVMGVLERTTPKTEDFEAIWKRFMEFHDRISPLSTDGAYYGVCFPTGQWWRATDYVAGMAVAEGTAAPDGLAVRPVAGGTFAVLECTVSTIGAAYGQVIDKWLPGSPYRADADRPGYEHYPPDTTSGDSPVFIHVPIEDGGEE